MSYWTHSLCDPCFEKRRDADRPVTRLKNPDPEVCCDCGETTTSGIYFRADGATMRCEGKCEDDTAAAPER